MRSYKGSNKEFSRYMQSELDDDYLEPLESDFFSKNNTVPQSKPKPSEPRRCRCKNSKKCRHPNIYNFSEPSLTTIYSQYSQDYSSAWPKKAEPITAIQRKTHKLTNETMRTCISNLGTDAKNCYYGLQEFKFIGDRAMFTLFESLKDIYKTLETINVLYLSVAYAKESDKIEAVYLWQMNEKCPCVKGEGKQPTFSILTDVKNRLENARSFPSLLLLAKITPEAEEEILEAKILGDNKLLIQSRRISSENHTLQLIYKIFNVTSFALSARVNPLQHNILANSLYSWKLKVRPSPPEDENVVQVSVWKKLTLEEIDLTDMRDEEKIQEKAYSSAPDFLTFVAHSHHGWTVLLDKKSSAFIVWKEDIIHILSFTEMMGIIHTFEVIKETLCVLINTKGQIFTLNICELPNKNAQMTPHVLPAAKEILPKIQLFDIWDETHKNLKAVGLAYFSEGKFYYVDIMKDQPATILFDLKEEITSQKFSWRFPEKGQQRVLFYIHNEVLNIYDLEKSRHQTQKLSIGNSEQKSRDWQIFTESPNAVYTYTVGAAEMIVSESNYKGEIDNFFKEESAIQTEYFVGESPIHKSRNSPLQIEAPYGRSTIVLIRMKEPVYQDNLHTLNYDGRLYYIPPKLSNVIGEAPEKRERCPYHKLVDRIEIVQKLAERYQYDEKCAEEAELIRKDIQELIKRRIKESKEDEEKYKDYLEKKWIKQYRNMAAVSRPEEIDYEKYLELYKNVKKIQKSLKAQKIRQTARPKNDDI